MLLHVLFFVLVPLILQNTEAIFENDSVQYMYRFVTLDEAYLEGSPDKTYIRGISTYKKSKN